MKEKKKNFLWGLFFGKPNKVKFFGGPLIFFPQPSQGGVPVPKRKISPPPQKPGGPKNFWGKQKNIKIFRRNQSFFAQSPLGGPWKGFAPPEKKPQMPKTPLPF